MDKFIEMMEKMKDVPPEKIKENMEAKKSMCICGACPSYNECAKEKGDLLFCGFGKMSGCITEEKGCTCPMCPLTTEMGLTHTYFCTKGSEKEQRGL